MKKDIEITFGKSVLIEKTNTVFSILVETLCNEVPRSRLNIHFTGTNTATIIRYAPTDIVGYSAIRLVCMTSTPELKISRFSQNNMRAMLHLNSEGDKTYRIGFPELLISDSRITICHNELVGEIISTLFLESKIILSSNAITFKHNISTPYKRSDKLNESNCLYGSLNIYEQKHFWEKILFPANQKTLHQQTNALLQKLKRKGRRLLKKSLTLEPIKTKDIKYWKTQVNG